MAGEIDLVLHELVPTLLTQLQKARISAYTAFVESISMELKAIELLDELVQAHMRGDHSDFNPERLDLGPIRNAIAALRSRINVLKEEK